MLQWSGEFAFLVPLDTDGVGVKGIVEPFDGRDDVAIFSGGDADVREAGESAASLGRCVMESVFPAARCRGEAVSDSSRIFGPGRIEAFVQETWPSVKGDSGAGISSTNIVTRTPAITTTSDCCGRTSCKGLCRLLGLLVAALFVGLATSPAFLSPSLDCSLLAPCALC